RGQTHFVKTEGGFEYGQELARFIKANYDFCIGGAAYPEGHIEAPDPETDLRHLKEKVESGAEFLITQLFFEPSVYFRFVERARGAGHALLHVEPLALVADGLRQPVWIREPHPRLGDRTMSQRRPRRARAAAAAAAAAPRVTPTERPWVAPAVLVGVLAIGAA